MCALLAFATCKKNEPIDEAKAAGRSTADFPQITADIFKPMDGGIDLSPEEIMGRNTWNLWSGGNEHFWNHAAQDSYGLMDLLKMLDNRKFPRGERFKVLGLVNEPGFRTANRPDEFGLWLDEEAEPEPAGIDRTGTRNYRPLTSSGLPQFVTLRGGAYFFLPSLRALRYFAGA